MATPLTVIGGFLGAGKTTLLNHVLRGAGGVRYAVLVNDFGEIAIDDRLVVAHGGDTVSFANGCVCCTLGDSLLDTVDRLLATDPAPDQFLVEASGVADPTAIADVATLHPDLARDLVIVLCDAASVRERAADERLADTVERQLAAADVLVLNHCDRVDAEARESTFDWLRERTGLAAVATTHAALMLDVLDAIPRRPAQAAAGRALSHDIAHPVHTRVVHGEMPPDHDALRERLAALAPTLLRAKGLLREAASPERWWIVQVVGRRVELRRDTVPAAPGPSALVLLAADPLPASDALALQLGLLPEYQTDATRRGR